MINFLVSRQAYELHFLVGAIIIAVAGRRWVIWLITLAVAKEIFDYWHHGRPDILDVIFTLFGGVVQKAWKWIESTYLS